jgi:nifU-like protein
MKKDNENILELINECLEIVKPYIQNDGGDIKLIKFEDGIVYIKLLGACEGCIMKDYTIKDGIESFLIEHIPEVKGVIEV